jgi:hypothetical protein
MDILENNLLKELKYGSKKAYDYGLWILKNKVF